MHTFIYFLLAFGYIGLLVWGLILSKKEIRNLANVLLLVIFGLIYDNLIIASGRFIGEGDLLEKLSYARFWLHALFTPTLVLFAWCICFNLSMRWAKKTFWKVAFTTITLALTLYELFTSIIRLELRLKKEYDVLSYGSVEQSSPVMVILVTVALIIVGIILLKKFHFPWLLIGTTIMIAGSIVGIWIKNFPIMNTMEFLLILSLLLTRQFQVRMSETSST